jgi:chromosome segregation ATPase
MATPMDHSGLPANSSELGKFFVSLAKEKSTVRSKELELARTKNRLRTVSANYRKKKQRMVQMARDLNELEDNKQHLKSEVLRLETEIKAGCRDDSD